MANTMTGRVLEIGDTLTIPTKGGSSITRRELILDCTRHDQYTGEKLFENHPAFEFSNNKCAELDNCAVNDIVTVSFDLMGRFYVAQDGTRRNMTSIRGYKVDVVRKANGVQAPQPMMQQQTPQPYQQPQAQPTVTADPMAEALKVAQARHVQQVQAPQPIQQPLPLPNDLPF